MADPAEPADPKDPADTAVTEGPAAGDGTPDGEADELAGSPGSDAFGAGGSGGAADAWPPPGAVATISATGTGALRSAARLALRPPAPRRRANWQRVPGVLFAAVTVLPAVLVMAWLIPGLPLLLAGRFAGIPMIVISVPLAVALVVMVLRELPSAWPHGIRDIRDDEPPAESPANQVVVRPDAPPESGGRGAGPAGPAGSGTGEAGTAEAGTESGTKAGTDEQPDGLEAGPGAAADQPDTGNGRDSRNQPDTRNRPDSPNRRRRPDVPWWALAATILVAAGFAVWQYAENSQQIIVLRDPGTYLQFAYWIAGHGSTRIPQSLEAFGGAHQGLTFSSLGFFQVGTTVVPQFMAGLPMTLAIGVWAGGPLGAAAMAPVLGACAVLAFAGLAGRLAGARWAPAAALVLAVSLPQQYTSRTTFSETLAQVMLYGGLCMLADSFVLPGGRHAAAYAGPPSWRDGPAPNVTLAFFAGLSLGLTLLIRIDGLSDLLPAIPFLGILLVRRRPQGIPFGIGLFIGAAYGFADGYLLSRPYLDSIGPSLRPLAMIALGAVALTVIGMGVMSARRPRSWLRFLFGAPPLRWLPEAAAALTVLAVVGFAVRPYFQTVRGETDPATISYVAELQRLAHLAVDPTRQYSEDSLYWVIWYIGVPAVILGAIGLALLARRCLRALLTCAGQRSRADLGAAPDDHLVGDGDRLVASRHHPRPALGQPAAGAGGPAGADPRRDLGVGLDQGTRAQAGGRPPGRVGCRGLLRDRPAGSRGRDHLRRRDDEDRDRLGPADRGRPGVQADRGGRRQGRPPVVRQHRAERIGRHPRPADRRPVQPGHPEHVRDPDGAHGCPGARLGGVRGGGY